MVPIGTHGTVLPYIDPTEGPPRFCMDWVGTGRFNAFCKKIRSFYQKVFQSVYVELYKLIEKHLKAHIQNFDEKAVKRPGICFAQAYRTLLHDCMLYFKIVRVL